MSRAGSHPPRPAPLAALLAAVVALSGLAGAAAPSDGPGPPPGLRVKGDAAFRARAGAALERLRRTATGRGLFCGLAGAGRTVSLRPGGMDLAGAALYPTGAGDSVVLWDPDYALKDSPSFVLLFHELVHALHEARSDRRAGAEEERRTVGLGPYAGDPLSENALRAELGLPLRRATGGERDQSQLKG